MTCLGSVIIADYPKDWPFPTKSLAAQEKTGETPLQANSPSLVEARLMPAKFRRFVTHMALQANYPCGQTFGKLRPDFRVIRSTSRAKWLQMVLHGIYSFGTKWNCCRIARKPQGSEGGCWKQTEILCPPDPLRGIGHYLETASVLASSSLVSS